MENTGRTEITRQIFYVLLTIACIFFIIGISYAILNIGVLKHDPCSLCKDLGNLVTPIPRV